MEYFEQWEKLAETAKGLEDFDSMVFVEIPNPEIIDSFDYRTWLLGVEKQWMEEFNGNERYEAHNHWNKESRIYGQFGEFHLDNKFYKYDGSLHAYSEEDFRAKRGFLIRDHYSPHDVAEVHHMVGNLEEFLTQQKIEYTRKDFHKHKRAVE